MIDVDFREQVRKMNFSMVEEFVDFDETFRAYLRLKNKYDSARLALGRSLAEPKTPEPVSNKKKSQRSIAGEFLFGNDELDFWISLFVVDGNLGVSATTSDLREHVEAHWARGLGLLKTEWLESSKDDLRFIMRVSSLLPDTPSASYLRHVASEVKASNGPVIVSAGPRSETPDGQPIKVHINASGSSPHIALMGKIGSGKTRTAMHIASEIQDVARVPFLFIDPKGEFRTSCEMGQYFGGGSEANVIDVGQMPVPLDFLPMPDVGDVQLKNSSMQLRDSICLCCKSPGDMQKERLRQVIESVLTEGFSRSLETIRDRYLESLQLDGKGVDSIASRLNELTALNCFESKYSPADFFSKSWALDLKSLHSEELKRLVILLVLDSLKTFLLSLEDSAIDAEGNRALRHLLVIDEARKILAEKNYQSLVDLIRMGRSKGSVAMLISQDPSDFHGKGDDFTTQLGTVIAFSCSQTTKGLSALEGAYGRKVLPLDLTDTRLSKGMAFCKIPGRHAERIHCW